MTDEIKKDTFRAPPMPTRAIQMPSHTAEGVNSGANNNTGSSQASAPNDPYANTFVSELNLPPQVLQTKVMGAILAGVLVFGMMMGCVMFGSGKKPVVQGLGDVVRNPRVTGNMRRCGQIDPNKECVLYIMNHKNFDRLGDDFFQEAQDITGVPKYSIQLSNTNYANMRIQPGWIAQLYIPARR